MLQAFTKNYPKLSKLELDDDYPERAFWYELYSRVLDGKLFDCLKYGFHEETTTRNLHKFDVNAQSTRTALVDRRPSVEFNIAKIAVNDSTSMLFDEGHFPNIKLDDQEVSKFIHDIYKNTKFKEVMLQSAIIGSLGSSAIQLQILKNKIYFKAFKTQYLTPHYDPEEPDCLIKIIEKYKITDQQVRDLGYKIDSKKSGDYWFCREWTSSEEIYYIPWNVADEKTAKRDGVNFEISIDKNKTVKHDFGFVPFVWIKNLPKLDADDIDGECTFEPIIKNIIEINYQLSQLGRGLKYTSEPMLLIKTDQPIGGTVDKSKGNALCLDAQSDAKMLEIRGDSAEAVIKYAETLRKFSLEIIGANRADSDKMRNVQSGKALEMLNQSLVWLVSKLRVSYGEAIRSLLRMMILATEKYKIQICKRTYKALVEPDDLPIIWPPFFLPTSMDRQADATALATLTMNNLMSKETAVQNLATNYDVVEPDDEIKKIESERAEDEARMSKLTKVNNSQINNE